MQRRLMLQLAATPLVLPELTAQIRAAAAAPGWKPRVLDDHQNETVVQLTELIIPATDTPGAKTAQVNRYIDLLLADGEPEPRRQFLEGLAWLDGHALAKHQAPFARLTADQQVAVLKQLDAGGPPELAPGTRFFRQLKQITSRIYYSTEIGFKELNKGGRVPSSYGCRHPEHA